MLISDSSISALRAHYPSHLAALRLVTQRLYANSLSGFTPVNLSPATPDHSTTPRPQTQRLYAHYLNWLHAATITKISSVLNWRLGHYTISR